MIKTLSPYYLTIPFVSPLTDETCVAYTLRIYVWDGAKDTPPEIESYKVTKNNPTASTGSDKINIARLLNDFIDFMPSVGVATGLINGNNQRWVKTTITYHTTNEDDWDIPQTPVTDLIIKGYGYGMDGENSTIPTNRILMSGIEFKVNRTGVFNVPVKILEV